MQVEIEKVGTKDASLWNTPFENLLLAGEFSNLKKKEPLTL
jgi:hypothetical protein